MKLLTEKFVLTMVRSLVISKPKSKSEIVAISTSTILMKRSFVVSDTAPNKVNDIKVNGDMQTDRRTDRLPQWFLVLDFAAKNVKTHIAPLAGG